MGYDQRASGAARGVTSGATKRRASMSDEDSDWAMVKAADVIWKRAMISCGGRVLWRGDGRDVRDYIGGLYAMEKVYSRCYCYGQHLLKTLYSSCCVDEQSSTKKVHGCSRY